MSGDDDRPGATSERPLPVAEQYALWVALVRGEMTEPQAAAHHGLDEATVRRISQVAEQGAVSALSTAGPGATALVSTSTEPSDTAGGRVIDLLAASPVFLGVPAERLATLARSATLAFLGERTPVADTLAEGPLVVADGTSLVVDGDGRPTDLVGRGAFRAVRAGRRVVPLSAARVAALPMTATDDATAGPRARLTAEPPDSRPPVAAASSPMIATAVLGDLTVGAPSPGGSDEGAAAVDHMVRLPAGTPLLDAVPRMLEAAATTVLITDAAGERAVGVVDAADIPLGEHAGLGDLLDVLANADTVDELTAVQGSTRTLVNAVLVGGADVSDAGQLFAAVGDQVMRRLLTIAQGELGAPPTAFAWLVFGSHARREQTPRSDQDTGLVYGAGLDAEGHRWFAHLGEWMTAALEHCGYGPLSRRRDGLPAGLAP